MHSVGVVVEAAPVSSFEMSEPDLLIELLIIALDTPTEFSEVHQFAEGDVFRQGRKPIFGRLFLTFGPFDQQPLFGPAFRACVISMCDTNPQASKARRQRLGRPLPPFNSAPGTPTEIRGLSGDWICQGQECDPSGPRLRGTAAQFCRATFLSARIFRLDRGERRSCDPGIHQEPGNGRSEAGATEPLALIGHHQVAQ